MPPPKTAKPPRTVVQIDPGPLGFGSIGNEPTAVFTFRPAREEESRDPSETVRAPGIDKRAFR